MALRRSRYVSESGSVRIRRALRSVDVLVKGWMNGNCERLVQRRYPLSKGVVERRVQMELEQRLERPQLVELSWREMLVRR
jgi:hypothetical protein